MKVLFISSLLLAVITHKATGQYQSFFGKNYTSWNSWGHSFDNNIWTDSVNVEKDTLVQNKTYKKVNWFKASSSPAYYKSSFLREDTTKGKLWHLYDAGSSEVLMVDMSLSFGDTFVPPTYWGTLTVDSIFYQSSKKFLRFNSALGYEKFMFIEGVGSNLGVVYDKIITAQHPYLLCQLKDDTQNYVNTIKQGICNTNLINGIMEVPLLSFTVYPNPTNQHITIGEGPLPFDLIISIIDVTGKTYFKKFFPKGSLGSVSLEKLRSGLYSVALENPKLGFSQRKTVLLNN